MTYILFYILVAVLVQIEVYQLDSEIDSILFSIRHLRRTTLIFFYQYLQSDKLPNSHAIKQKAETLPELITELLEHEEFFSLLPPYIDDYFEKLEIEAIKGLNAAKLKAVSHISHLRQNSRKAFLIAKSDLFHRYREGVIHMETAYTNHYKSFKRGMDKALKTDTKKSNAKAKKGKRKLPKKPMATQANPHAHQQRVNKVVEAVNSFATQYTGEINNIRRELFP